MKIGINLVGVSYNNAVEGGRLRRRKLYTKLLQKYSKSIKGRWT